MGDSSLSLSPEPLTEVTVGSDDLIEALSSDKKLQEQSTQIEKDKRKGVLSGEAYSRAVDRYGIKCLIRILLGFLSCFFSLMFL